MKEYGVYILLCSDNTYYTGVTNDLDRRLAEHMEATNRKSYTARRRPLKLVFYQSFDQIDDAIEAEKQIKKWSVAKKRALINSDFDLLPELSRKVYKR